MKKYLVLGGFVFCSWSAVKANIHTIGVWDGYFQFVPDNLTIQLGDTVQWLPYFAPPTMLHTITSTTIPAGAVSFDETFQPPADTFYQYIPLVAGTYNYKCTPHSNGTLNMVGSFTVTGILATASLAETGSLAIYPNLSADYLQLSVPQKSQPYRIVDVSGREIATGMAVSRIDIRGLTAGNYFLQLEGDRPRTFRFLKE